MNKVLGLALTGIFLGCLFGTTYFLVSEMESNSIEHGRILKNPIKISKFHLKDYDQKEFTEKSFTDLWTVITFGFTNCPDVCPTAMASFRDELNLLTDRNSKVQFVFVSVDPERDSPAKMKSYLSNYHKSIIGVSGDTTELKKLTKAFHVHFQKSGGTEDDYSMAHNPQFFLINPQGEWIAMYTPPFKRGNIAMDLSRVTSQSSLSDLL